MPETILWRRDWLLAADSWARPSLGAGSRCRGAILRRVRILLVSDLHYDLRKFDWVLAHATDPAAAIDVVVVAGDVLDIAGGVPLDAQITVVLSYLERLAAQRPTMVCSGNHDLDHRGESGEKATRWLAEARIHGVHVDGDSFDLGGWRLTACEWWEGPATLAALEARLLEAAAGRPGRWLWAFHGPPEGVLSWTGSRHYGDPELPRLLELHRPDVVLCGHIHEAPFTAEGAWAERRGATWLFNPGHERGPRPTFIELDLDGERAYWRSASAAGEVDLAAGAAQ
jgi:Icc-related predicted phosphoesterase